MSDNLLITPGSRKLEIKDSSGNIDAKIETDSSGNLLITNAGGDIAIGDTTSDIFVGDGTNNIDIVFEQDGEIRGTSGVTVTLGASGSNVRMATDLNLNSNDITNVGTLTAANLNITGTTTTVSSTNTTISDSIIELNSGLTGANSKDIGFIFERGSTGNNAGFVWDESADRFTVFTTTDTASSDTVNTSSVANFQAGSFFGNGANLSSLNASNISSGTLADARLGSQVFLGGNSGTITGNNSQSFDTFSDTGIHYVSNWTNGTGTTNGPSHEGNAYGWGMLRVTQFIDSDFVVQEYIPHNDDGTFIRVRWSGTWGPWRQSWGSRSDGAGSGLDADKLDGQQGSYYQNASNINAGTINTARLPNPIHLSGGNAIIKLQETDVTNNPTWWHVADGGNYSIRLNNTGAYPISIETDSDNDAVTQIGLNYTVDLNSNKLQFGTETTSYIQNQNKQSTDVWRFQTEDGYIDIGSENTSWAHLTTDRNSFYFAPKVTVQGDINPYQDSSHNLGTSNARWANVFADTLYGDGSNITGITSTDSTKLPLSGGTMSGNIAMGNYNITGVNQLEINDPGEGIVFKAGSSGDMVLKIIDDSSDNILQYAGTNAVFDVVGTTTTNNLTVGDTGASGAGTIQMYVGSNDVATDNTGLTFTLAGSYSDGRYEHRFRKEDKGGGIPLYIDKTSATANAHTEIARFGSYTNNADEFEVYGTMSSDGYRINNTQVIDSSRNLTNIGTISSSGDLTQTKTSGNNIIYINSSGGGNPVIYMEDSTRKWGQFVSGGTFYLKNETANIETVKLNNNGTISIIGNTSLTGQLSATTPTDGTPAIIATNSGGNSAIIQRWVGSSDALEIFCESDGDYFIRNNQQNNGVFIADGTGGVVLRYNGSDVVKVDSNGGLTINTGGLKIAGTTVITNSRNIQNVGSITSTGLITAGSGSGGVSLTHNDGEGNANVTFNHKNGTPEQNGQSARITVNTDGTSTEAVMAFEVSSADVTSGTALGLPVGAKLAHDYLEIPSKLRHSGDTNTYLQFDADRIRLYAGGAVKIDTNNTYLTGITSSQVTTALGYTPYQENTALSATTGAFSDNITVNTSTGGAVVGKTSGANEWFVGGMSAGLGSGDGLLLYTYDSGSDIKFYVAQSHKFTMTNGGAFQVGSTTVLDSSRNLTNIGTISSSHVNSSGRGTFVGNAATPAGLNALNLLSSTNGGGVAITFTDNGSPPAANTGQRATLQYWHSDGASYGSGNAFVFDDTENSLSVVADGKILAQSYYMKPSSGTGAGTQVINSSGNWVGGGNVSQFTNNSGYLTSSSLSGYATESYVTTQVNNLIDSAPGALNTLNELAAAIGDDASFSTTMTNNLAGKVPLAGGTMTGTLNMNSNSIQNARLSGSQTYLPGHAYSLTHDGTSVYWHIGSASGSTNKVLNLRIYNSSNNYVLNQWSPSGLTVAGYLKASGEIEGTSLDINGNADINGTSSSGNALIVKRGSDNAAAIRIQNTGEVVTEANYLYAASSGTSFYVQNTAVFRGNILNDTSGQPVTLADDVNITGDVKKNGTTIVDGSRNLTNIGTITASGNIQHTGLTMTAGTDIDQLYGVTKSLTLTTSWQDTGIIFNNLATGSYIVQVSVNDNAVGGQHYTEMYTGVCSWYGSTTNSTVTDEILLHRAGHAPNNGDIFLRTARVAGNTSPNLHMEIRGSLNNTGASNYVFKFRRLL